MFTNTRSRSSSRAPEARNGSDSSKAKSKKSEDTEKSSKPSSASEAKADDDKHRENEQYTKSRAVPIYSNFSFCFDEFPCLICPSRHRLTIVTKAEIDKQERNQRILCGGCLEPTDMSQAAYSCKKGCKLPNGDRLIICNRCNYDNAPSTGPVIACMLKDCANIKLPAISNVINRDEEFTVPMRLKPAMVEILRIHNSPNPIKPQDIEEMEKKLCIGWSQA